MGRNLPALTLSSICIPLADSCSRQVNRLIFESLKRRWYKKRLIPEADWQREPNHPKRRRLVGDDIINID